MSPAGLERRRGGLERGAACHPSPKDAWVADGRREPPLAELLADPMMTLLWASARLDPAAGHATVRALQALLQGRGGHDPAPWPASACSPARLADPDVP